MGRMTRKTMLALAVVLVGGLLALESRSEQMDAQAAPLEWGAWAPPVNIGPPVNTAANENTATFARDGTLYFASNRGGNSDLWVSRRECNDCPWDDPVHLGPNINSLLNEGSPSLSRDGHFLFFASGRSGNNDLWMSYRSDTHDDFDWEPPVHLGPEINTEAFEAGASVVKPGRADPDGEDDCESQEPCRRRFNLYFNRSAERGGPGTAYRAVVTDEGAVLEGPEPIAELNAPTGGTNLLTVRHDGKEVFFWSFRPGSIGNSADIWTATRRNVNDPWSTPVNLGTVINTANAERDATLSFDGRSLLFMSIRGENVGGVGQDLWMATREP